MNKNSSWQYGNPTCTSWNPTFQFGIQLFPELDSWNPTFKIQVRTLATHLLLQFTESGCGIIVCHAESLHKDFKKANSFSPGQPAQTVWTFSTWFNPSYQREWVTCIYVLNFISSVFLSAILCYACPVQNRWFWWFQEERSSEGDQKRKPSSEYYNKMLIG